MQCYRRSRHWKCCRYRYSRFTVISQISGLTLEYVAVVVKFLSRLRLTETADAVDEVAVDDGSGLRRTKYKGKT